MNFLERPSWQLAILSGVLVGISYLPLNLSFCIYFGFIPILHLWIINNSKSNFLKYIKDDNINLQNLSLLMLHPDIDKFRIGYRTYAFDDKLTIQEHLMLVV